ncbi:hypothetical protein D3C85_1417170 [compost metagenome]
MIFHVLRQFFAVIQQLFQLRMGDITRHDNGAIQGQTGGNWVGRELRQDLAHRLVQVNADHFAFTLLAQ